MQVSTLSVSAGSKLFKHKILTLCYKLNIVLALRNNGIFKLHLRLAGNMMSVNLKTIWLRSQLTLLQCGGLWTLPPPPPPPPPQVCLVYA